MGRAPGEHLVQDLRGRQAGPQDPVGSGTSSAAPVWGWRLGGDIRGGGVEQTLLVGILGIRAALGS